MRKTISDEIIEIAKKHENLNERMEIYWKMMARYIEWVIVDERMREQVLDDVTVNNDKVLDYDKVVKEYKIVLSRVAEIYSNAMNIIHYMHDKYA